MVKFQFATLVGDYSVITARLGAGSGPANNLTDAEVGKFFKLAGESRYDLSAVGNEIESFVVGVETATLDGFTIGSVVEDATFKAVTFDGLQATPGTGTIAIGDYVLVGTPVAKGTAHSSTQHARVVKATDQAAAKTSPFAWRVESLGSAGTGAVGTNGVIHKV